MPLFVGRFGGIDDFRNFDLHPHGSFDARWTSRSFDLEKLDRLELDIVPFGDSEKMAHTMMIFGILVGVGRVLLGGQTQAAVPAVFVLLGVAGTWWALRTMMRPAPVTGQQPSTL